jgi:hypothetical protein
MKIEHSPKTQIRTDIKAHLKRTIAIIALVNSCMLIVMTI